MKFLIPFSCALLFVFYSCRKKEGCTDPIANNYDSKADTSDNSCTYDTPDGIIHYYSFDESSIVDEVGNSTIQIKGEPQATSDRNEADNSALLVKGTTDYLLIENVPEFAKAREFSISFWYYNYSDVEQQVLYMFSTTTGGPTRKVDVLTNKAHFITDDLEDIVVDEIPSLSNQWVHYIVSYSGEQATVYINGEMVNEVVTRSFALQIEGEAMYFAQYFEGRIDELVIFDRPVTAEEVPLISKL